jgi:hypothetical protein
MPNLFRIKPMSLLSRDADKQGEHTLKRALGALNLITPGIYAGIFLKNSGGVGKATDPQSNRGGNPCPAGC